MFVECPSEERVQQVPVVQSLRHNPTNEVEVLVVLWVDRRVPARLKHVPVQAWLKQRVVRVEHFLRKHHEPFPCWSPGIDRFFVDKLYVQFATQLLAFELHNCVETILEYFPPPDSDVDLLVIVESVWTFEVAQFLSEKEPFVFKINDFRHFLDNDSEGVVEEGFLLLEFVFLTLHIHELFLDHDVENSFGLFAELDEEILDGVSILLVDLVGFLVVLG